MGQSRNIAQYFEVKITDLKPGVVIPFTIHLYFAQNAHLIIWRKAGELLTDGFLDKYQQRGVSAVWVHQSERALFESYLNPTTTAPTVEATPASAVKPPTPKTPEAKEILGALQDDALPEEKKKEKVAEQAQKVFTELSKANTPQASKKTTAKAREVVKDLVDSALGEAGTMLGEMWNLANIDKDLSHGLNVSTYSVIFALAFGRIDTQLLSDLALAGLLHDIGMSQLSPAIAKKNWKEFSESDHKSYSEHIELGMQLLSQISKDTPERVKAMITQHHEKFDGTGYPSQLKGFQVDDISQLLGMAELLDSICSGQWDGSTRTIAETLQVLESIEKARTFPEYFNPEIFSTVMKWTRNEQFKEAAKTAVDFVGQQTKEVIENKKAA